MGEIYRRGKCPSCRANVEHYGIPKRNTKLRCDCGSVVPKWRFYADYTTVDGRRIRRSLKTTDRVVAKEYLAQDIPGYETGKTSPANKLTAIENLIEDFLKVKAVECAAVTVHRYRAALDHFHQFLKEEGSRDLARLTPRHVARYKQARVGADAAARTINNELRVVRTFLNWLVQMGDMERHPFQNVPLLKVNDEEYRHIDPEQALRLLQAARLPPDGRGKARGLWRSEVYEVVMLGLYAGLRRGEIWNLDPKADIDLKQGIIIVRQSKTKSKRRRIIPIHPDLRPVCEDLRKRKPPIWPWEDPRNMWRAVKAAAKRAGLPEDFTLHHLRHTFLTWLAQNGANAEYLRAIAGHSDLRTSSRYIAGAFYRTEDLTREVERLPSILGTKQGAV